MIHGGESSLGLCATFLSASCFSGGRDHSIAPSASSVFACNPQQRINTHRHAICHSMFK